jgi:putative ABC transport system permease protein
MRLLDELRQDLRFAFRSLWKAPVFTAVAVATLALGIGANSAIFSVVDAVLLRPLDYREPDRLMTVLHDSPQLPAMVRRQGPVSPADYLDWKAQNRVFERLAAAQAGAGLGSLTTVLTGRGTPEELSPMAVTADLFPLLGVNALVGRGIGPGDDQPGAPPTVVLGHSLWQRRFGGDRSIVGQTIVLDGVSRTVVGVMPPSFRFAPFWYTRAELWLPLVIADPAHDRTTDRNGRSLRVLGRLRPGLTRAQAQADMDRLWHQLEAQYPATDSHLTVTVDPLQDKVVGSVRRPLLVLLAAVALVLLIGCANVANLLLARAAARRKELGLRTALGASRGRLVRQLLVESLVLAIAGGALGVLLAQWGVDLLLALGPRDLPRREGIHLDGAVLAFTLALSLGTGLVFGLIPALQTSASALGEALKEGNRTSTEGLRRNRMRSLLVVSEVSLALMLLVGAGLLIKSFRRLQAVDPGFNPHHLMGLGVPAPADPARREAFFDRVLAGVRAVPGVSGASAINHLPIDGDIWGNNYVVAGRPPPRPGDEPEAVFRIMRPGYLATMGIPLARGRDFTDFDRARAPAVMIVNEAFARAAFPAEEALGKRILFDEVAHEIVGITADARQKEWAESPMPEMYLADRQHPARGYLTVVVRASGDPAALITHLQRAITALDSNLPPPRVVTMEQAITTALWQPRFNLLLLNAFAALALLLAAVGIYGVMAYSVSRRTREIGIRVALGATAGQVQRLVAGQGLLLTAAGVGLGLIGAFAATRLMSALLFGVRATDPTTFVAVPALLLAVGLVACYLPARRATRVDPVIALHHE